MKISMARNTGIENAKGMYCWFIDGDDYIEPNVIEKIINEIKNKEEVDTFFYSFSKVENSTGKCYPYKYKEIFEELTEVEYA